MNPQNPSREMDALLARLQAENERPRLLLHSCCAPCSSYVLEYLCPAFAVTVFFYNPNIYPQQEYTHRLDEQRRLIAAMQAQYPDLSLLEGTYAPEHFFAAAKGYEDQPEGGARCEQCFKLRLEETARLAVENQFDYFATTLTVSPHKNAPLINTIGTTIGQQMQINYLPSDFKKKGGYQRSIALSKAYGLYRQNYCGCVFAK